MAGVFDIDIHDPDMGNNVDFENEDSDDDVIEVEVIIFTQIRLDLLCSFFNICLVTARSTCGSRTVPATFIIHGVRIENSLSINNNSNNIFEYYIIPALLMLKLFSFQRLQSIQVLKKLDPKISN